MDRKMKKKKKKKEETGSIQRNEQKLKPSNGKETGSKNFLEQN